MAGRKSSIPEPGCDGLWRVPCWEESGWEESFREESFREDWAAGRSDDTKDDGGTQKGGWRDTATMTERISCGRNVGQRVI